MSAHVRRFFRLGALLTLEFVFVYAGTNYLTSLHDVRIPLYLDAELAIPFVPGMLLPYLGMVLIFPLAPLVLRDADALDALAAALAGVIAVAGVGFLLLPATLGYQPVDAHGWTPLLTFADRVNLDFNLVPSLHVALFVTCAGSYARHVGTRARWVLAACAALVCASTVLTHQHHVVDVLAGVLLGRWGAALTVRRPQRRGELGKLEVAR